MIPQDVPNEAEYWWGLYLATRSKNRFPRQVLLVGLPFLLIIAWTTACSLLLAPLLGYGERFQTAVPPFTRFAIGAEIVLPPTILILVGVYFLLRIAIKFMMKLYNLPTETESEIGERIWHRLWGWYSLLSNQKYVVVKSTQLEESGQWVYWMGGPAILIVYDGFAAYIERGSSFSRIADAGFKYLDARETVKAIVDLRPQIERTRINAWTNDGIKVTLMVQVEFQIKPNPPKDFKGVKLAYPCDIKAVQKAVEYTAVRIGDGKLEEVDWCGGALGSIQGLVAHLISSHHYDELFMQNESGGQMLSPQATSALIEKANERLEQMAGVHVLSLQITDISIPAEIRDQRLNVWGAKKDSLVSRIQGEAQAYRIRTTEEARAKAQRDLIVAITKSLGQVDPSHLPEPLLLSLSGILDQGLRDPLVQTYMAKGTLDALERLKDWL